MRVDWNHLEVCPFLNNKKTLLKKDTLVKSFKGKKKKKHLPMVFSRFLEWKEENLIATGRLKVSCGQRDCEWLYSLKASGTKDILIHIHAWDEHSLSQVWWQSSRKLFNCRMSVRGNDCLCEYHWIYLFSRQMCPLWQNTSLAAKCITMLHLLREGSVVNEFHERKGFSQTRKAGI